VRRRDFSSEVLRDPPDLPAFVQLLDRYADAAFSSSDWRELASQPEGISIRGATTASLFSPIKLQRRALRLLDALEQVPLCRALALLNRMTSDRELGPDVWLNIGVVRDGLGESIQALRDLGTVIERYRKARSLPEGTLPWPDVHYHRGRVLLGLRRHSEAEAALEVATRQNERNARAFYYLARALRRLIATDLARLADESMRRYLALGAPLGVDRRLVRAARPAELTRER